MGQCEHYWGSRQFRIREDIIGAGYCGYIESAMGGDLVYGAFQAVDVGHVGQ